MRYYTGSSIPKPTPFLNGYTVKGDYNPPGVPGSMAYENYTDAYNTQKGFENFVGNISSALGALKSSTSDGVVKVKEVAGKAKDTLGDLLSGDDEPTYPYDWGNSGSGSSPSTPQQLQYIDAPYAEMYGMDASTAYQEALANTSYQRKVKDLQAAGLNPVLGYSGAGAASFYGSPAVSTAGGVSYGSSGSGKTTSGLSDSQKDTLIRNLPNAIGGIVSIVKGPSAGAAASSIGNAVGNIIRYWD